MQSLEASFGPIFTSKIRRISVIAPAGPPDAIKMAAGLDVLKREKIEIVQLPAVGSSWKASYLAADLSERIDDFNRAIRDERTELILCARGGFGSSQLLDSLDWQTLRERNLPIIGYSDVTAIHAGMLAMDAGIPIAAPMLLKMPELSLDAFSRAALRAALAPEEYDFPELPEALETVQNECAASAVTGKPFAANLTVLSSLCGTAYFPDLTGRILIIEDVNEPLYKIDRMLTQLALNKVFGKIAALLFGEFTGVPVTAESTALCKRTARLVNGPVWRNFRFGHTMPMAAVNARETWNIANGKVSIVRGIN